MTKKSEIAGGEAFTVSFGVNPEKPIENKAKDIDAEVKQYTHSTPPSFTARTYRR